MSAPPPIDRHAPELSAYFFLPGRPAGESDDLLSSVVDPARAERLLREDVTFLPRYPADARLRVVGFTDDRECFGDACIALSLRRARAIHAWLDAHGMPADRLLAPCGHGSAWPVELGDDEASRAVNRRGYVSEEGWDCAPEPARGPPGRTAEPWESASGSRKIHE